MPCELEQDSVKTFPGLTLFSKRGSACRKPTAVYLPPKHLATNHALNVVLWLHGFYVKDHRYLFHSDAARVREQVLGSGKDVVLIAPFLGYEYLNAKKEFEGDYSVAALEGEKWGERYLDEVLAALARFQNPSAPPALDIKNLVIACHSGGGGGMRKLVGTLGKYQSRLKECWGFDCLYGKKIVPDDATFWYQWVSGQGGRPLHIVYGPSTLPQSVKLYLMGRGKATSQGNKADPPRAPLNNLHVTIGHYETYSTHGQTVKVGSYIDSVVDDLMTRPSPKAKPSTKPAKSFVEQAADNLMANFIFVEQDDIHYFIARAFFLSKLRSAPF